MNKKRKLAAILFADIVGYTSLMQKDEVKASSLLRHFQQQLEEQVKAHKGQIVNFYGDGALCTFQIPIEAVRCAMDLQTAFQNEPKTPVRIGIHSGTVTLEGEKIFGDSVNITSRIESMGVAGGVLLSKKVRDEVKNNPDLQLQSLGNFEFKNVEEPMAVFALANEGFVIPKRAEIKGKLKLKNNKTNWLIPVLLTILLAIVTSFWFFKNQNTATTQKESPSIAVLPFEDMSANKDQAYFADGIAEEILNTLAQLEELKVAGRTSSFSFKGKDATIIEIGEALKVNHVLEGSVRKQGDKIRITAQLIKVDDGYHVWSEKYDRDFDDVFKIQDELAQNIGKVLLEKLAPEQLVKLKTSANHNGKAYELFLKAKHISWNQYLGNYDIADFKLSEKLFLEAIAIDSNYALAHAGLAELYDTHFLTPRGIPDRAHYEKLKLKEAEIAYQLAPDNYYVNAARGWAILSSATNAIESRKAYESFLKAYQLNPQSTDGLLGLATFYSRKSLIADAHRFLDKTIELDPLQQIAYVWKARYFAVDEGVHDDARKLRQKLLEFDPNNEPALRNIAVDLALMDKKEEAIDILSQLQNSDSTFYKRYPFYEQLFSILTGDTEKAKEIAIRSPILSYFSKDTLALEKNIINWLGRIHGRYKNEASDYFRLIKNPIYESVRAKSWFQEAIQKEKEKYERYYKAYPRAEEILIKNLKD